MRRSQIKQRKATGKRQLLSPLDVPVMSREREARRSSERAVVVSDCDVDGALSGEVVRGVELAPEYIVAVMRELVP